MCDNVVNPGINNPQQYHKWIVISSPNGRIMASGLPHYTMIMTGPVMADDDDAVKLRILLF